MAAARHRSRLRTPVRRPARWSCWATPSLLTISGGGSAVSSTSARARFLMAQEWATTAEDIVTRRTKHALHMTRARSRNSKHGSPGPWRGVDEATGRSRSEHVMCASPLARWQIPRLARPGFHCVRDIVVEGGTIRFKADDDNGWAKAGARPRSRPPASDETSLRWIARHAALRTPPAQERAAHREPRPRRRRPAKGRPFGRRFSIKPLLGQGRSTRRKDPLEIRPDRWLVLESALTSHPTACSQLSRDKQDRVDCRQHRHIAGIDLRLTNAYRAQPHPDVLRLAERHKPFGSEFASQPRELPTPNGACNSVVSLTFIPTAPVSSFSTKYHARSRSRE